MTHRSRANMACSGLHCCDDFNGFSPKAEEVSRNLFLKPGPASLARLFHLNLAREDRPMASTSSTRSMATWGWMGCGGRLTILLCEALVVSRRDSSLIARRRHQPSTVSVHNNFVRSKNLLSDGLRLVLSSDQGASRRPMENGQAARNMTLMTFC